MGIVYCIFIIRYIFMYSSFTISVYVTYLLYNDFMWILLYLIMCMFCRRLELILSES